MKTTLLILIAATLFSFSSYADDGPGFVKVGGTYMITGAAGVALPQIVIVAANGGGGWYRVTLPKETNPDAHHSYELNADMWINFNQLTVIRDRSKPAK